VHSALEAVLLEVAKTTTTGQDLFSILMNTKFHEKRENIALNFRIFMFLMKFSSKLNMFVPEISQRHPRETGLRRNRAPRVFLQLRFEEPPRRDL
jgi:hypothetical protein